MRGIAILLLAAAIAAEPVVAQQPPQDPATAEPPPTVDATKLGVSLERIRKGLRITPSTESESGTPLKLNFQVQVFGTAPPLRFFEQFDPVNGPDRYGAPSHSQMVQYWTPEEFRSPAMPISALAFVAGHYLWGMAKKARCEEEIRQYRAMVMQGVDIAAPRCTQ